jgi:peptidylprolyl isomerase
VRTRDLTLPIALGLILSGVAALVVGAVVLIFALTDDDGGAGGDFVTTNSGLQYRDTKVGDGDVAEQGKIATVHYTGSLTDTGDEPFDTSVGEQPFGFLIGATQVIPGWDEGVAGMKEGGSRTLIIPPALAYGEQGAGQGIIPPNATLTFDIMLLAISDPPPDAPPEVSGNESDLGDGLIAIDIVEGDGAAAVAGSRVAVHYTGWLKSDGKQFDSSLLSRQTQQGPLPPRPFPVTIGAGEVIDGWDRGLPGMKEGGVRRLIIPAVLAYGDQGQGEIPGNADLIFDIELIEIIE